MFHLLFLLSFSVKKPDINEIVNKTSIYNKTVYVGNLPDQISGKYNDLCEYFVSIPELVTKP